MPQPAARKGPTFAAADGGGAGGMALAGSAAGGAAADAGGAGAGVEEGWVWSVPTNTPTSRVLGTLGFSSADIVELNASAWTDEDYTPFADELARAFGVQLTEAQVTKLKAIQARDPVNVKSQSLTELLGNLRVTMMPFCQRALLVLIRRVGSRCARRARAAACARSHSQLTRRAPARPRDAPRRRPLAPPRSSLPLITKLIDAIDLAWTEVLGLASSSASGCVCVGLEGCEPGMLQTMRADGSVARHTVHRLAPPAQA